MRARCGWHWWLTNGAFCLRQSASYIVAATGAGLASGGTINRHELMEGLSLGSGAEPTRVIEIIEVFLQVAPALVNSIRDAIASNDARGMTRALHTLRSSAAIVAVSALSRAAAAAETHAREGRIQEVRVRIPELAELVDAAARTRFHSG